MNTFVSLVLLRRFPNTLPGSKHLLLTQPFVAAGGGTFVFLLRAWFSWLSRPFGAGLLLFGLWVCGVLFVAGAEGLFQMLRARDAFVRRTSARKHKKARGSGVGAGSGVLAKAQADAES